MNTVLVCFHVSSKLLFLPRNWQTIHKRTKIQSMNFSYSIIMIKCLPSFFRIFHFSNLVWRHCLWYYYLFLLYHDQNCLSILYNSHFKFYLFLYPPCISRSFAKSHFGRTPCVEVPLIGVPDDSSTHQQYPVVVWHCADVHLPSDVQLGTKIPASGLSASCSCAMTRSFRQSWGSW